MRCKRGGLVGKLFRRGEWSESSTFSGGWSEVSGARSISMASTGCSSRSTNSGSRDAPEFVTVAWSRELSRRLGGGSTAGRFFAIAGMWSEKQRSGGGVCSCSERK